MGNLSMVNKSPLIVMISCKAPSYKNRRKNVSKITSVVSLAQTHNLICSHVSVHIRVIYMSEVVDTTLVQSWRTLDNATP